MQLELCFTLEAVVSELHVTDKIVGKARLPTDDPDKGIEAHVLFDQFEVLGPDPFESEALAHEDKHVVLPYLRSGSNLTVIWIKSIFLYSPHRIEVKIAHATNLAALTGLWIEFSGARTQPSFILETGAGLLDLGQGDAPVLEVADSKLTFHRSVLVVQN